MNLHGTLGALLAALSLTLIATTSAQASEAYSHDPNTGATNADWMAKLPDGALLSALSLPGTHDTGAYNAGGDFGLTQSMTLQTQLDAGIRAWDIRLKNDANGKLTVYHGIANQGIDFDKHVMTTASNFLDDHPSEALVMRLKCEEDPCNEAFDADADAALDRWTKDVLIDDGETVGGIRGKIVVLKQYGDNVADQTDWDDLITQDVYEMNSNWDLAWKWWQAKNHFTAAQNDRSDKLYANFLSASGKDGRGFPYFFASGKSSPQTDAPPLLTGMTRGGIDTCSGNWRCLSEFPDLACHWGTCSVGFKGINHLAAEDIGKRDWPSGFGLVYADFPGKDLIKAIINSNFPPANLLQAMFSRRCVDVAGAGQAPGTAVKFWDCNGNANQRFTADNGALRVYINSCLQPRNGATANGTPIEIRTCMASSDTQRWEVIHLGTIKHIASGKCLDVSGNGTANGTALILWECHNGINQRWQASRTVPKL